MEELVSSVRNVEVRVRDAIDGDLPSRRSRRSRHQQQMLIEETMFRSTEGPSDPINLLLVGAMFKDEAPWLYELAVESYRGLQSKDRNKGVVALRKFAEALDTATRGPFFDDFSRMPVKMIRHEIIDRYLHLYGGQRTKSGAPVIRKTASPEKLAAETDTD